jgi:putative membrane protein
MTVAWHMVEHLIFCDLLPLVLALAATPRRLAPLLRRPALRRLGALFRPVLVFPVYAVTLAFWHVPAVWDAALASEPLHQLQHASLFATGLAGWLVALGRGPRYVSAARSLGRTALFRALAMPVAYWLLFLPSARYADASVADQQAAGGVMLVENGLVTLILVGYGLRRTLAEAERRADRMRAPGRPGT